MKSASHPNTEKWQGNSLPLGPVSALEILEFEHGRAAVSRWKMDGIAMDYVYSEFTKNIVFPAGRDDEKVRLHFGLRGNCNVFHQQLGQRFESIGMQHNFMYSKGFDIEVHNKSMVVETFGIQFDKSIFLQYTQNATDPLKRFAEAIVSGKSSLFSPAWPSVDMPIKKVITQIMHSKYEGEIQKLFLLSKSIELLVLAAEAHLNPMPQQDLFVKLHADKDRLTLAKELIDSRLHQPPSLNEICAIIGINEYKLKRGFKEMFGHTVFGYMTDQRLNLALNTIRDSQQSIAEIAFELGYATPQHFNNAFKKKFGRTPFLIRKNPDLAIVQA